MRRRARALGCTWVACALATLFNPYGIGVYRVAIDYLGEPAAHRLVKELRPADFSHIGAWFTVILAITALTMAGRTRRAPPLFYWVAIFVGNALAIHMVRDCWIGIVTSLSFVVSGAASGADRSRNMKGAWVLLAVFLIATFGFKAGSAHFEKRTREIFPVGAAEFLARAAVPGPMFNPFDWGGYLIGALPQQPVSIDGRTNLYSEEKLERELTVWGAKPGWESDPDLARARIVISPRGAPLVYALSLSSQFKKIYSDDNSEIFERSEVGR